MLKKEYKFLLLLLAVAGIFFYQFFLLGKIPFPGDLLISEYNPWKSYPFLGFAPGGLPNKAQYFDVLRQLYPWKILVIESFKSFHIPLWNPYNFSGTPLLANDQSAIWYPFNILYFILSQSTAWALLVILQPLLASVGTYLFVRKIGVGKWGSLLSSVAYGYSLFQAVFLEYNTIGHCIALLPWSLLGIELLIGKRKMLGSFIFIGSLVFSFFAGHIQVWGFSVCFILAYSLFRFITVEKKIRFGLEIISLYITAFLFTGVQLIPTLELIQNAARVSQNYQFLVQNLLIQPYQLLVLAIPDIFGNPATRNYLLADSYPGNALYIGITSLIFAFYSLITIKISKMIFFFWGSLVILLLLLVHTPFTEIFYRLQIPFFSTGSPSNALFLVSFSFAILAGFGFDYFLAKKDKRTIIILLVLFLALVVWVVGLRLFHVDINMKNVLFSFTLLIVVSLVIASGYLFRKKLLIITFCLLLLTVCDLFYFFNKFNPFVSPLAIYPSTSVLATMQKVAGNQRVWSYGDGGIEANVLSFYHLEDPNGYDPLYPKIYGEFISSSQDGKIHTNFTNQSRSDAVISSAFREDDLAKNPYRFKLLNALSVSYILSKEMLSPDFLQKNNWKLKISQDGWNIYQNLLAVPHAYLVNSFKTYRGSQDFSQKFYSNDFNLGNSVLLDKNIDTLSATSQHAVIEHYSPESVEIKTDTNGKSLLLLTDTYFPGWKAFIDGKETSIIKANFTFRAVEVPNGIHTVIFAYQPASFSLGLTLTIIGLVSLIGFLVYTKRNTSI